jgi:tetratricopeptide (TPR) repeat protein
MQNMPSESRALFMPLISERATASLRKLVNRVQRAERLSQRGDHRESDSLYHRCQRAADAMQDSLMIRLIRADVRTYRAQNCIASGDGTRAGGLFEAAQSLYDSGDLPLMRLNAAVARYYRAQILLAENRPDYASKLLSESQAILDDLGDDQQARLERLRVTGLRAQLLANTGERRAAESLFAQAQSELRTLGHHAPMEPSAVLLFNCANNLREMGRFHDALMVLDGAACYQRGMSQSARSASISRSILISRAGILTSLGRYDESERLLFGLRENLEALSSTNAITLEKAIVELCRAANLYQAGGRHEDTDGLYTRALTLLGALPDSPKVLGYRITALNNRAGILRALGLHQEAEDLFREVDGLTAGVHYELRAGLHAVMVGLNRCDNLIELDLPEHALSHAECVRDILGSVEDTPMRRMLGAHAARSLAECLHKLGRWREADLQYERAQALSVDLPESHLGTLERVQLAEAVAIRLAQKGAHEQALALFDMTHDLLKGLPDSDRTFSMIASLWGQRAVALTNMGRYDEAELAHDHSQAHWDKCEPTRSTQLCRAQVRSRRATNLMQLGHGDRALELNASAQALYDSLPDSPDQRDYRFKGRMARAILLIQAGQFAEANRLYHEVREQMDTLVHRESMQLEYAIFFLHYSNALSLQGKHAAAENLLAESQAMLDALPDRHSPGLHRAGARLSRAKNFRRFGRYDEALGFIEAARSLFESLPASEIVRIQRSHLSLEQCRILLQRKSAREALVAWREGQQRLALLRDASGIAPVEFTQQLGSTLFELYHAGVLSDHECEQDAARLAEWLLDWTDLADPGTVAQQVAKRLRAFFGDYLSWLIRTGRPERVAELLSMMFGRFAAAELVSQPDVSSAATQSVRALALSIRGFNCKIGRLEEDPCLASRSSEVRESLEHLYEQRANACREFRRLRREIASDAALSACVTPIPYSRIVEAVERRNATLVILFLIRTYAGEMHNADEKGRAQAIGWILSPGMHVPSIVMLPPETLDAADMSGGADRCGTQQTMRGPRRGMPAASQGQMLREAVKNAWAVIQPKISTATSLYVAPHQELGHLPWPAGLPTSQAARMRMFHGVTLAVDAMERDSSTSIIAPPEPQNRLVVLAHSPSAESDPLSEEPAKLWLTPIPYVYSDAVITAECWPYSHRVVADTEELLTTASRLVQISTHGDARTLLTGPNRFLSAFEFRRALDQLAERNGAPAPSVDILITVACSTSRASTNILGESGGWSVLLQGQVRAVLGALYPTDDQFSGLWLLLIHQAWRRCGDLRLAVAEVRERMRSGQWTDSVEDGRKLVALWAQGLKAARTYAQREGIPGDRFYYAEDPDAQAERHYQLRQRLYEGDPGFQAVTEAFVIFG